jgi:hypothetical protein
MTRRLVLLITVMGLVSSLVGGPAWGDDGFYVIPGGGRSGKVLKTQLFTSGLQNPTLGRDVWDKLDFPQWTYTKLSSKSYLVITYQDALATQIDSPSGHKEGISCYQLRVNGQPSDAGPEAAQLTCFAGAFNVGLNSASAASYGTCGATGVWSGLSQGDATLSIWHRQKDCSLTYQNTLAKFGVVTTTVLVTEIEP